MERPSHSISSLVLQSGSRRFAGASLTLIAQLSFGAVLIGGIVDRVQVASTPPLQVREVDRIKEATPPPPVKLEKPALPTAVPPVFDLAQQESGGPTITTVTQQPPLTPPVTLARQTQTPPAVPDRAATAITGTHTSPPYPTLARRLGAQGKVMLRLTVLPDGSVGKAEVMASSGRQDLDQAAAQWVTGHWIYKPAIRDGVPAASQVQAAIQFSLSDAQ